MLYQDRVITNVTLAGGTGTLGTHILKALIDSGTFKVTVLTRNTTSKSFPPGVSVKTVDYSSPESLFNAVSGQDAVIDSTYSAEAVGSCHLIDACVAAGVYRYILPGFGSDPVNELIQSHPFFQHKGWLADHFSTPPLKDGSLGIDIPNKRVTFYGDGEHPSPWSTLEAIGKATAQSLIKANETLNRIVYISSINISQKKLVSLAKEVLGTNGWDITSIDVRKKYDEAVASSKRGSLTPEAVWDMLRYTFVSDEYTYIWPRNDNELLKVKQMGDNDVKELIKLIARNRS